MEQLEGSGIQRIDCDVHPNFRDGLNDLVPYLSTSERRRVGVGQAQGWSKEVAASHFSIPTNSMYINPLGAMRRDIAHDGGTPASNPDLVRRQLLDEHAIDRAILLCGNVLGLGGLVDAHIATSLANAYNQWLHDHWLSFDRRYRGGLVVAPQDIDAAVETVRRFGKLDGFVQVHIPMKAELLGEKAFHPLYAVAQEFGYPIAVHPNSIDGIYRTGPQLAGGTPTYYSEWHTGLTQLFQANVISLVCHGTFVEFPDLHVVITEGGFAWLPDVMWRLDKDWRGLRDELPWLTRPPSEYVLDHFRFTTQPMVEPRQRSHLAAICDIIAADRTLLFSTDYPHWDFDDPDRALRSLPDGVRARVYATNALALYGSHMR